VETLIQSARPTAAAEAPFVERLRAGDPAAFAELVAAHKRVVYGIARRLLGTHEDADEAAQIAFVKAWRSVEGFRGDASLRTWLVRIVLNVARSMRQGRRTADDPEERTEPADSTERGDERLRRLERRRRVRRAVARLPRRQREVVVLKVFSELTHREVAGAMGLSEGAVKAHLHQAVANLRRLLDAEGRVP
jgi:RNA polymerase sigma-70 factor (ECF subfamily)